MARSSEDQRAFETGANRVEEAELRSARAQRQHDRARRGLAGSQRAREREVFLLANPYRGDVVRAEDGRKRLARVGRQRRGEDAVTGAERNFARGQPLDLFGEPVVEEEADR